MKHLIEKCKIVLKKHYGSKFHGLILYGSLARDEGDQLSDIDLLVLLNKPFKYFQELRQITDILYPIQLESEQLISAKPVETDDFENGEIQLYRNAKHDGFLV